MGITSEYIDESTQFFLEATEKPMAVIELNGDICEVNENFTRFFKVSRGSNINQIIAQQSSLEFTATLEKLSFEKSIVCHFFMKVNDKNECTVKTNLYFNHKTNVIILLFALPIKFRENQEKNWLGALKHTSSLLFLSTKDGYIQDMNDLSYDFFNLSKERFIGNNIDYVLSLFSEDSFNEDAFKKQALESEYAETVQQYIHPTKNIRYYKIMMIQDHVSDLFLLKITDYTEKILLQEQLGQTDSMLEVGQMAASVAHEIRNPITTLKGFTQLLKITADEDTTKYLNVIEDEIERMENILSEMLTLSKPTKIEKKPLSLKGLLDNIIQVISPKSIMENIKIVRMDEFDGVPFLLGDEGRLKQVFLNLFKNSLESMQPGGTLTIYMQHCGEGQVNVIIKDTGKGIEAHNLTQVFMPYFTTRSDGTGLGMPFVLQTVEDHGGTISVSSEVGIGTSFIVTFPIIEKDETAFKKLINSK